MKVSANLSTQPTEVSAFVAGRKDAVQVELSFKTRSDNSKAPDSHLLGKVNTHFYECED